MQSGNRYELEQITDGVRDLNQDHFRPQHHLVLDLSIILF